MVYLSRKCKKNCRTKRISYLCRRGKEAWSKGALKGKRDLTGGKGHSEEDKEELNNKSCWIVTKTVNFFKFLSERSNESSGFLIQIR